MTDDDASSWRNKAERAIFIRIGELLTRDGIGLFELAVDYFERGLRLNH